MYLTTLDNILVYECREFRLRFSFRESYSNYRVTKLDKYKTLFELPNVQYAPYLPFKLLTYEMRILTSVKNTN